MSVASSSRYQGISSISAGRDHCRMSRAWDRSIAATSSSGMMGSRMSWRERVLPPGPLL